MATKLKNLKVTKVDFVDTGANPEANIMIFKRQNDMPMPEAGPGNRGLMDTIAESLAKLLEKAWGNNRRDGTENGNKPKLQDKPNEDITEGEGVMRMDRSKLSAEELETLKALEAKAGIPDDKEGAGNVEGKKKEKSEEGCKEKQKQSGSVGKAGADAAADENSGSDVSKGMPPEILAELDRLRKMADAVEERELTDVAKRYELIGKKPDELVPVLKNLKAAGGEAYDQMLAVLDASLAIVEKSGLFAEIGKRGGGEADAWAMLEKRAEEIQKRAPDMTWAQAVDKACEQNPQLVSDYENGR